MQEKVNASQKLPAGQNPPPREAGQATLPGGWHSFPPGLSIDPGGPRPAGQGGPVMAVIFVPGGTENTVFGGMPMNCITLTVAPAGSGGPPGAPGRVESLMQSLELALSTALEMTYRSFHCGGFVTLYLIDLPTKSNCTEAERELSKISISSSSRLVSLNLKLPPLQMLLPGANSGLEERSNEQSIGEISSLDAIRGHAGRTAEHRQVRLRHPGH